MCLFITFINCHVQFSLVSVVNTALRSLREVLRLHRWPRYVRGVERRRETTHDGLVQQYIRLLVQDGLRPGIIWKSAALPNRYRLRPTAGLLPVEELRRRVVRQQVGLDAITRWALQSTTNQHFQVSNHLFLIISFPRLHCLYMTEVNIG